VPFARNSSLPCSLGAKKRVLSEDVKIISQNFVLTTGCFCGFCSSLYLVYGVL
jgi:hypothetical protein